LHGLIEAACDNAATHNSVTTLIVWPDQRGPSSMPLLTML